MLLNPGQVPSDFHLEEDKLLSEFVMISGVSEVTTYSQVPSKMRGEPNLPDADGDNRYPFGYRAGDPENWADAPNLSQIVRPSETFAVLDRRNLEDSVDSAHLTHRNILFLDGHVRRVPLEDFISFTEIRF